MSPSPDTVHRTSPLPTQSSLDVQMQPGNPPMVSAEARGTASSWMAAHRDALLCAVTEHGSLLVRGLDLHDAAEIATIFQQLGRLMGDREAFAARRHYADRLYSSSNWPPTLPMCMHHTLSYVLSPPSLLLFACLAAPTGGGATLVADSTAVLRSLPTELVERFERLGWMLIRNYNGEIGVSLADALGSDNHRAVESYCRANAIEFEWQQNGILRTWQCRSAVVSHPCTGQRCWFNQIAFLNAWTLEPEVREYLVDAYGEAGLPFDTRFGNGDPIGPDIVRLINRIYDEHSIRNQWQPGDLLLVDNIRTAHGRERFEGKREVLVAMADAVNPGGRTVAAGRSEAAEGDRESHGAQ
ncbi:TauD/TfdA family dioxygenase [Burkholderia ubonensis]|uniref:TauD/TfdA family dioxygenase n=1 Tax=Burkholderia ubonensis TaxID=101571 RepID=UPI0009B349B6|nr:TauD/TfdA family dioxygenase [Burkholderia ubonensis]